MKLTRSISTVEVHTDGEPFRIVTSGLPRLPGKTIVERRTWLKDKQRRRHSPRADVRTARPRRHVRRLSTQPVSADADFGIIFLHNEGYSDHCGHGVIVLATAAVELG